MYRRKYFAAICALYIPTRTLYMVEDHKMFSRQITSNLIFKACAVMHRFIVVCAFMCRKLLKHEQKDKLILMRNNRRLWHAYSNEFLAKAWGRKFCVCAWVYENSIFVEFNLEIFTPNTRNNVAWWWRDEVEGEKSMKGFLGDQAILE